jgi:hypothetical protein
MRIMLTLLLPGIWAVAIAQAPPTAEPAAGAEPGAEQPASAEPKRSRRGPHPPKRETAAGPGGEIPPEASEVFEPEEEISEDYPVPLPSDI